MAMVHPHLIPTERPLQAENFAFLISDGVYAKIFGMTGAFPPFEDILYHITR